MEPNFTLTSSSVDGFKSSWNTDYKRHTESKSVQNVQVSTKDQNTNTQSKYTDSNTQTDKITGLKQLSPEEELKLNIWLKKILPRVEEELNHGVTYIAVSDIKTPLLNIVKHQTLKSDNLVLNNEQDNSHIEHSLGSCCWLSVTTQNAPTLATCVSAAVHKDWCNHSNAQISIWVPNRHDPLKIIWNLVKSIPVKTCVKCLIVNPFNRDIFAGGSVTGDLYIWNYQYNNPDIVQEIFFGSSQCGSIVDMDWIKTVSMSNDSALLTCHEGFVVLWKIGHNAVVKDKIFRIQNTAKQEPYALTTICTVNSTDFILGTIDGYLLMCSISNSKQITYNEKSVHEPIITMFGKQTFAISRLQKLNYKDRECIACSDVSGVIHVYGIDTHIVDNREPLVVIKVPMPLNQRITCTKNLDYILCASTNGETVVLRVNDGGKQIVENNLRGNGTCIELTNNGNWLVSGAYESEFQIFRVETEG
uniref:CSON015434 protein n=1 Tax=Culicoides sonorensis TaxID=179676 RepID=A0A336K330_CULSO